MLAVGAVNPAEIRTSFSSIGPSADGRVKPDVAAQGSFVVVATPSGSYAYSRGTSFAAPLLAGMAAGFWQAHPNLTNVQVMNYLKQSGTQAQAPDNLLGYGIPNFKKADALASECAPQKCVPVTARIVK